jgi:hypothetical protein
MRGMLTLLRVCTFFYDVNISFTRHNQGRNWRTYFNQECWLMLLGLHLDYVDQEYVETILALLESSTGMPVQDTRQEWLILNQYHNSLCFQMLPALKVSPVPSNVR